MPFAYDLTQHEWPADGSEPPPPKPEQFEYLPPPELGGAREPVHFVDPSRAPAVAAKRPSLGIVDRMLDRTEPTPTPEQVRKAESEERIRQLFAILLPALRELGGRRIYCRYDGGNDEGFSWLDSVELANGQRIDPAALTQRLLGAGILDKIYATGIISRVATWTDQAQLTSFIEDWIINEWAIALLGQGYGTGEYVMYGAFTVDLDTCTITDDPKADPIVQNIEIAAPGTKRSR